MNLDVRKIVEKFDRIVSHGTLEHMDDPLSTLRFFKSHLNPKGQIIITTPNWTNLRGHILMTLWYLFNAPITLADLHYFTPRDFSYRILFFDIGGKPYHEENENNSPITPSLINCLTF